MVYSRTMETFLFLEGILKTSRRNPVRVEFAEGNRWIFRSVILHWVRDPDSNLIQPILTLAPRILGERYVVYLPKS
jgi:hypothetical protein